MSKEELIEGRILSGIIPEETYWQFKAVAAQRKEKIKDALEQAALMYIHACDEEEEEDVRE